MEVNLIAYMQLNNEDKPYLHNFESEPELIASTCMHGCVTKESFDEIYARETEEEVTRRIEGAVRLQHHTVAGFTEWLFEIREISRVTAQQLTRHRTAWYLSQSQRSINQWGLGSVVPESIQNDPRATQIVFDAWVMSQHAYSQLVDMGIPLEDARYVVPQSKHTSLFMKIDGSNLIHFLKLRMLGKTAQAEIKELATKMYEVVKPFAPTLFSEKLQEYWW
jgi:thymidylate synthase (FAD)